MFRRILSVLGAAVLLWGCVGSTPATGVTPTTVCQALAAVEADPAAAAQLAAIAPTSALGVVWADFQSGCVAGQPAAGVSASWTAAVGGMFKTLLPQILPTVAQDVLPLLVGLL